MTHDFLVSNKVEELPEVDKEYVLGIDSGATRMGFCLIQKTTKDDQVTYEPNNYGTRGVKYDVTKPWNEYRQSLIRYWAVEWPRLVSETNPDRIVSERLPIGVSQVNGGSTQRVAGIVAVSICQLINLQTDNLPWEEVAAITVKNSFFTKEQRKEKGFKSKIAVRNVICKEIWPEFWPLRTKLLPDESDAMGIALYGSGLRHVVE